MATRTITAGRMKIIVTAKVVNTMEDGTVSSNVQGVTLDSGEIVDGTDAYEADRAWSYVVDVADGVTQQIDVYDFASLDIGGGAGNDSLGQSLVLAEIVGITIHNRGPGWLEIDDSITGGFSQFGQLTGAKAIKQGGWRAMFDPQDPAIDVTDSSDHLIDLTARSGYGNLTCEVHLLGRSA